MPFVLRLTFPFLSTCDEQILCASSTKLLKANIFPLWHDCSPLLPAVLFNSFFLDSNDISKTLFLFRTQAPGRAGVIGQLQMGLCASGVGESREWPKRHDLADFSSGRLSRADSTERGPWAYAVRAWSVWGVAIVLDLADSMNFIKKCKVCAFNFPKLLVTARLASVQLRCLRGTNKIIFAI